MVREVRRTRIGRRPTYLFFVVGFAVFAWPAYRRLEDGGFGTLLVVELIGVVLLVGNSANVAAIYAELFPASVRTTGTGLHYAVAVAVFGGTAPYLTTWAHRCRAPGQDLDLHPRGVGDRRDHDRDDARRGAAARARLSAFRWRRPAC